MNRLAKIALILLITTIPPAQAQEACSHNWEEVGGNAKLDPFPTRRPVSSSHGWVEDFRGPSLAPLAEIAWCNICNDATAQETWGIQCASSNGGYGWTRGGTNTPIAFQDIANLEAYIHDNMQEENLFMEAADNAYHFTRCQDGLFSSYFGQASVREDMLNRAYSEFDRIRTRVLSREQERDPLSARRALADSHLSCIKDSCAGRISTETVSAVVSRADDNSRIGVLDEEINQLLIGVPMANRQGMRDALRTLLRSNPNANQAAFTAVFDREMRQMKDQVDQTLQMFDGPRREGGGIRHSQNGKNFYCIDHSLKRDMYASGLVDNVLEGYPATVRGERGLPCRACSRYGMAGQVTAELLMIPTYFIGYGFARLGAKVGASVVRAGLATRATIATRMAMLGLQGVDYALFANSTVQSCFGESFLVGSRGQSCNPENEVAQAFQEAAIGQCLTNIAFFGMSQAVALRQMRSSRGVAAASDDVVPPASVLDDVAEAAAEPTVVTASRRNFALNRQESARLESSLRSRGISSETELTDAQLLQLSSDERLFLFEEISGTALTVRESRSLTDLVANIQRTGWSGRNINRLTRLLRETDAEDIPTIIARLRQRRTLDLPAGAATPRAPTPPRPAVGPAAATEEELIRQFATRDLTTREQNAAYLALARTNGRQSGVQFIDMQNIVLKRLNDQLRHKPLVDALNNRHAAMLEEAIHRLRDDFPTLRIETYSDYKGARFALTGVPAGQESRLAREIARLRDDVDARFLREIQSGRYPTISRDLSNIHWYRTEVDETADFANIQVRTGLDRAGIQNLWNGIRTQRSNLQSRFGTTPLMRALDEDASVRIPTAEVFEILRKKSDNALVARILNRRHNLNLSADDVQLFRTYADDVDRFSPNLQIDARVQHDFSTAAHGGITLDFGGLGSLNAEATAAGLARGFDLRSSVRAIRTNEAEVTQYLARTMEETETAVRAVLSRQGITARITRSGDDVVVIPDGALSPGVRDEILQAQSQAQARVLEQTGRNTNVRVSFFGSNVSGVDDRAILAAEGEGIEKVLRDRLEFLLPPSVLRRGTFGTDMLGSARGSGPVLLRTNGSLSPEQLAIVQREFRTAVNDYPDTNFSVADDAVPSAARSGEANPSVRVVDATVSALTPPRREAARLSLERKGIRPENYDNFFDAQNPVDLSDDERLFLFEHFANVRLSDADSARVIALHNIGDGYGTYTHAEIRAKTEGIRQILAGHGVTGSARLRSITRNLLDQGVLGSRPAWRATPLPPPVIPPAGVPAATEFVHAEAYMETAYFRRLSSETRHEITTDLTDFSQARSMAMRFRAFEDLGFGPPGQGWTPMRADMPSSTLNGRIVGWEITSPAGTAHVRLDWDEVNGAHYNIMIQPSGDRRRMKLAIRFACGGRSCTAQEVLRLSNHLQDPLRFPVTP